MSTTTTESSTAPQRIELRGLEANRYVEGVYGLTNPQVGTTRNGKPYLKCLLGDATGEISARQWSFDENRIDELSRVGFVRVAGHTQAYNGQIQLVLERIEPVVVTAAEMTVLVRSSRYDIDTMFAELTALLGTVGDPALAGLVSAFLEDEEIMSRFRLAPAAASLHHAWIGGLLEHTLQLMRIADRVLPLYPDLNRDLVLVGLFLHDIGKTAELDWEQGFRYTTDGNLVGHIVRAAIWIQLKAVVAGRASGHPLAPDQLRCLQHVILSHHGLPEHGAAKIPATPEAIFVSQLDDLDAKTQMALSAAERDMPEPAGDGGGFTDRIWALNTRLYRPDPFAPATE